MAPKREWPLVRRHDHEAGSSFGARNRRPPVLPPPPRSLSPPMAFCITPLPCWERRQYVDVRLAEHFWEHGIPMPSSDVHLPHRGHLSPDRVPMPPVPPTGRARRMEIKRRHQHLPEDLINDPDYAEESPYWDA
ncbi:uncharacterized protein LOC104583302 [Brachypodium distachyon]|uniref:uncharacterized protein LOC104583302 n=1 Tax=Brachypodium distachyon TaxID=15368 RepID=UPI00053008EA|nr:uncharacterized protein LOC104583302 [Brachypodium distachyon]|eukprot:XP_010233460.1 uncharacterized protein LOC104583302 [Brachypodium distachyon]